MIYKNSLFRKELKQAYSEYKISIKKLFSFGVFLGLFAFAVHFLLQTVYESVLTEKIPEIMLPSYFSVTFTYTNLSFIFFLGYFLFYFNYLTFAEIQNNSWYLLVKMKYKPVHMIFSKLAVRFISVLITYSTGFFISILLTTFLKYTFVDSYFFSEFLSGLIDIVLIVLITMVISLYFKVFDSIRIVIISSAVFLFILKVATGYYRIVSDRVLMQDFHNLFDLDKSFYLIIIGFVFVVCIAACIFKTNSIAKFYRFSDNSKFAVQDYKTNQIKLFKSETQAVGSRFVNYSVNTILIIFIIASIAFNTLILMISVASPEKEVDIYGIIPYVFQSSTMQPDIMKNDLAYFKKIDVQFALKKNDIVLFKNMKKVYVERIINIDKNIIKVDIDYYPPMSEKGSLAMEIDRKSIYGLFNGRNRWLGALILFANTVFGRLLFLIAPSILIFFYKPITNFFKRRK